MDQLSEQIPSNNNEIQLSIEDRRKLVSYFSILIGIDRRLAKEKATNDENNGNTSNTD